MKVAMSGILSLLAVPAFLAASPSPLCAVRDFSVPAADSAAVWKAYKVVAVSNPSTRTALQVGSNEALRFTADLARDSGRPYSARASVRIPIAPSWAAFDLRETGSIQFRIRSPGGPLNLLASLGSDAYRYRDRGVVQVAPFRADTSWQTISISMAPTPQFAWLEWMEDDSVYPGGTSAGLVVDPSDPNYDSDSLNAAKSVRYVEITLEPQWKTDSTWSRPPAGPTDLYIDDVRFESFLAVADACYHWPLPGEGFSCGLGLPSVVLSENAPATGDQNGLGGWWSAYLDTGAALGRSSLRLPAGASAWHIDTTQLEATLVADLARSNGGRTGGFAGLTTRTPQGTHLTSDDLQGIGFSMRIPAGAGLDSTKVDGVWFKVGQLGIPDSSSFRAFVPGSLFREGKADLCVDFWSLGQPSGGSMPPAASFSPREITSFSWELAIRDTSSSVPNQGISVGPVSLYGVSSAPCACPAEAKDCSCPGLVVVGSSPRTPAATGASASWRHGRLVLAGFEPASSVEIRTLEGVRVASLSARPESRIDLPRGTYLVVGRRAGAPLVRPLIVAR